VDSFYDQRVLISDFGHLELGISPSWLLVFLSEKDYLLL